MIIPFRLWLVQQAQDVQMIIISSSCFKVEIRVFAVFFSFSLFAFKCSLVARERGREREIILYYTTL